MRAGGGPLTLMSATGSRSLLVPVSAPRWSGSPAGPSSRTVPVMARADGRSARNGAAFFDLDRTLLKRASGRLLNEALADAGVIPDRPVPGMGLVYRFNDLVGESLPAMALARGAAFLSRGW